MVSHSALHFPSLRVVLLYSIAYHSNLFSYSWNRLQKQSTIWTPQHTCIPDADGSTIVDGVLLVVDGGVVPHTVEVLLELVQGGVLECVDLLAHRAKVHRLLDHIQVVGNLKKEEGREREREGVIKFIMEIQTYAGA